MELSGLSALVTGGAYRVGKAVTLALARAGVNVLINYHSSASAAQETATEARELGVRALPYQADVSDPEKVAAMVDAGRQALGAIQVLVNAASLWRATPFPARDLSDWHRVTRILIDGSFYCANALAPEMVRLGKGAIINVVDLSAWEPFRGYVAHSVGKSALWALTRQLAVELAPGVRVNAIAPGPVLPTPNQTPSEIAGVASRTLLGRWGAADDVSEAVLFLLRSDYITGEVIVVDGGQRYGHL